MFPVPISSKLYLCRLPVGTDQEVGSDFARVIPSTQNVCLIPFVKIGEKIGMSTSSSNPSTS